MHVFENRYEPFFVREAMFELLCLTEAGTSIVTGARIVAVISGGFMADRTKESDLANVASIV